MIGESADSREHVLDAAEVTTADDLARLLRALRRRHARQRGAPPLSYRELAQLTGWAHSVIGEYFTAQTLPPTNRFDKLVRLLGATSTEQGALATARDRVEERRRIAEPPGRTEVPVPRDLPSDVYAFTGRAVPLAELDRLHDTARPSAVSIIVVSGTAAVGKTALVVHWAHRVRSRFPHGQLYIDLHGYGPGAVLRPVQALDRLLRELGAATGDIPSDQAARSARYRTLLASRRVLVVLDNAKNADQVRPLLPGSPSCLVIVTSRNSMAGLVAREGARRLDLGPLPPAEAVDLLHALIGERGDPATLADLANACARLPLALRIAAERLAAEPGKPVAKLAGEFIDPHRRLDLLAASGDGWSDIRKVFSWSYRRIPRDAARAFRQLGLVPGREVDGLGLAALTGTSPGQAARLAHVLTREHLAEPAGRGRLRVPKLLHDYAGELAVQHEPDGRAAMGRLLDYYTQMAVVASNTLYGRWPRCRQEPQPARAPAAPATLVAHPAPARAWLAAEQRVLVAVAVHAALHGWPDYACVLAQVLWGRLCLHGHGHLGEAFTVPDTPATARTGAGSGP